MRKKKILLSLSLFSALAIVAGVLAGTNFRNTLKTTAEESTYKITLNNAFAKTVAIDSDDQFIDGFTYKTSNGNNIKFNSSLMFLPPDGWGGFTANCWTHADAYFCNSTAITGIKSTRVHTWFIGANTNKARVITAHDANFTQETRIYYLNKGEGSTATLGEVFNLEFFDNPSYIKFMPTEGINEIVDFYSVEIDYSCAPVTEKHLYLTDKVHLAKDSYEPSEVTEHNFKDSSNSDITLSMFRAYYIGDGFFKTGGYKTTDVHNVTALPNIVRMTLEIKWVSVDTVPMKISNNADFSGATSITLEKGKGGKVRDTDYETFYINLNSSRPSYFKFLSAGWSEYALAYADIVFLG